MGSWMEKYERRQDEKREKELNEILEEKIDDYNYYCSSGKADDMMRIKKLEQIIDAYTSLILEVCEYNHKDYEKKSKELSELKIKLMKEKHDNDIDSKSWEEFKKEEMDER